jgi:hypothetical protein
MGGPGFIGWKLEKTKQYPAEWLVLTFWGGTEWVKVNKRVLDCHDRYVKKYPRWIPANMTFFSDQSKLITKLFSGYTITEFSLSDRGMKMTLKRRGKKTLYVEVPDDLTKLPPYDNGDFRSWDTNEEIIDGLLLSETEFIDI